MVQQTIRKLYYNFADTSWHDYTQHEPVHMRRDNLIIPCDKIGQIDIIERFYMVPKTRGGGIFDTILNGILWFFGKILGPIIKPIRAIVNTILLIVKLLLYIGAFILWMIRLHVWFFLVFLPSLPADIMLMVKSLTYLIIDGLVGWVMVIARRVFNKFGDMTLKSIMTGADNVPDSDADEQNSQFFNKGKGNGKGNADGKDCGYGTKCYKTSDGTIPFSVIIATILCPPVGVFMEYGVTGWFNIVICALLTLVFYFPGLIYALILLYC
jgi:uncharacterized membrane protein YqaE (UPF0057 family)